MSKNMTQTDQEFVAACGLASDPEAGREAIRLRKELAGYGHVVDRSIEAERLRADMTILDTGIIHPADSLDLVEFTLNLECMVGVSLTAADAEPLIAAGSEEMELGAWIREVIDLKKRKMGDITSRGRPTPTSRPVSMIFRNSNLHPAFNARPRW